MTAACPLCRLKFRNKNARDVHLQYCNILEKHRGRTYVIVRRENGEKRDLIHVNLDAELYSHRSKKTMYDYPEEIEITGGFRLFSDGSGLCGWSVINFLSLERMSGGHNEFFYAAEATEDDLDEAKVRLGDRFDRLVVQ